MKKKLHAKKDGTDLLTHSRNVAEVATYLAERTLHQKNAEQNKELIECVRNAALLHDIGKATTSFQKRLTDVDGEEVITTTDKIKFAHNEVGWAFLVDHYVHRDKKKIRDAVYWHHGIRGEMGDVNHLDILKKVPIADIEMMRSVLGELVGQGSIAEGDTQRAVVAPNYYHTNDDDVEDLIMDNSLIRMCVCTADRIVSRLETENNVPGYRDFIEKVETRAEYHIKENPYPNGGDERFKNQTDAVDRSGRTTLIKAPAGFGKTLTGLMWAASSERNKKLLWVCPRNSVATSLYDSVIEELRTTGNNNIKVELFLTNEVKKSNHGDTRGLTSDITIINIDSFLSPTVNYRGTEERLFLVNNADVIFDEFHELVGEGTLFAAFVNILSVRHRLTNSRTLLMSATPGIICDMPWFSSTTEPIVVLPSTNNHYPAAHSQRYTIEVADGTGGLNRGDLLINNTITNCQLAASTVPNALMVHSKYTDEAKEEKYRELMSHYGKNGDRNGVRPPVSGCPVIQASLDVSFRNLTESVISPESTLQRMGRCNRWGDMGDGSVISVFRKDDRGENMVIREQYDEDLSDKWWVELNTLEKQPITLDRMYEFYNNFNRVNRTQLKKYLFSKHRDSMERLGKIYPRKHWKTTKEKDVLIAGGNKLRETSDNSIFYICKRYGTDEWVGPFNTAIHFGDVGEFFGEDDRSNILKDILGVMESLVGDPRFDYKSVGGKHKKSIKIEHLRASGVRSDTPYVRFDEVYHERYGLMKKKILNTLSDK